MTSKILTIVIIIGGSCVCGAGTAGGEGLDALIDIARGQKEISRQYKEETEAFENVRSGVERGRIVIGEKDENIRSRYGAPVIVLKNADGSGERWVYKPASASFFDGDKIYLSFDKDGRLINIEKQFAPGANVKT